MGITQKPKEKLTKRKREWEGERERELTVQYVAFLASLGHLKMLLYLPDSKEDKGMNRKREDTKKDLAFRL